MSSTASTGNLPKTDRIISANQLLASLEKLGSGTVDYQLRSRIDRYWNSFALEVQSAQNALQYELACVDGVSWINAFTPWKLMYSIFGILPLLPRGLENRIALYKKTSASESFTYQAVNIDGEIRLLWHTNIFFGKGCFKKGKAVVDMHTGKIFAQLVTQKPHKVQTIGFPTVYLFGSERDNRKDLLSADTRIEARTYIELDHPNILNALFHGHITTWNSKGNVKDQKFSRREIIVEHCLGDYGSILDKRIFTGTEAVRIATEYAAAIRYMHKRQYFHLDLKPDNLLVDPDKRGKVADFGCSISLPQTSSGKIDLDRLKTVLEERRRMFPSDIQQIREACSEYQKNNTSKAFNCITSLLGKIDVLMFSSVIQDILATYSHSIVNQEPLRQLLKLMQQADIKQRPSMEEVFDRLNNMNVVSRQHSSASALDRVYENCAVM